MSKHPIDNLFKKRFEHHEANVPDHIWSSVSKAISEEAPGSRRGLLWWQWSSLAVLLVGLSWWGYESSISKFQDNDVVQEISMTGTGDEEGQGGTEESKMHGNNFGEDGYHDGEGQLAANDNTSGNDNTEDQIRYIGQRNNSDAESSQASVRGVDSYSESNERSSESSINFDYSLLENQDLSGESKNQSNESQVMGNGSLINQKANAKNLLKKLEEGSTSSERGTQRNETKSNRLFFSHIDELPMEEVGMLAQSKMNNLRFDEEELPSMAYGKNAVHLRWSLGLNYGYDFVQRSFMAKTPDYFALEEYRRNNELISNAFTVGFEVAARWRNWTIITGLHMSQVNDRFEYILEGSEKNVNGQVITGTLKKSVVNRYQSFEIPILAEYGWGYDRFRVGAIFGAQFGLNYTVEGQVFDDKTLMVRDLGSKGEYVDQLGVIPVVGMTLGYQVGYNGLLFVRPTFKYYSTSLTTDSYGVDHAQAATSFMFGYRYML